MQNDLITLSCHFLVHSFISQALTSRIIQGFSRIAGVIKELDMTRPF